MLIHVLRSSRSAAACSRFTSRRWSPLLKEPARLGSLASSSTRVRLASPAFARVEGSQSARGFTESAVVAEIASDVLDVKSEAPRNPLGVQLLTPEFSRQIFPTSAAPIPPLHPHAISLSQAHLHKHGLSPSQASVLPSTSFNLPPLQGKDLGEHFWNIGRESAQPWLSMSEDLAKAPLIPPPSGLTSTHLHNADDVVKLPSSDDEGDHRTSAKDWVTMDPSIRRFMEAKMPKWLRKSGWVRYPVLRSVDGEATALGDGIPVDFPLAEDSTLVFDVEVMVKAGPFAVMATAAGPNAWYSWLSPWLLGESDKMQQLMPFGSSAGSASPRLLVGHNVGFDRARILDEYQLGLSNIRFLDTQSLHVAVRGISSPQRPAWIQHRKRRAQRQAEKLLLDEQLREEQRDELHKLLGGGEMDDVEMEHLSSMGLDLEALTDNFRPSTPAGSDSDSSEMFREADDDEKGSGHKLQWQDISSTNSLADVAALHCNIHLPKEMRNVFVEATDRQEILDQLESLLDYCARDVVATQAVFSKVLPAFRETCQHPATFAGVLSMGSPILPVDDEWLDYQTRCDTMYEDALTGVRDALVELAEALREEHSRRKVSEPLWWQSDPWLCQLDWTPKKPKKPKPESSAELDPSDDNLVPKWYRDYVLSKKIPTAAQSVASHLILPSLDGSPLIYQDGKWIIPTDATAIAKLTTRQFLTSKIGQSLQSDLGSVGNAVISAVREKTNKDQMAELLTAAADTLVSDWRKDPAMASRVSALDWSLVAKPEDASEDGVESETWPKWYWDLYKPASGRLELTIRTKVAPLLLKVSWRGCPLFSSREHGWIYLHRPLRDTDFSTRQKPLTFTVEADESIRQMTENLDDPALFYKVPHTAGEEANVGSPFSKSFMGFFDDGTLRSDHPEDLGKRAARDALDLNAQCSYWIGVRDRVASQMVVWEDDVAANMGFTNGASGMRQTDQEASRRKGLILPQVITMGTVTRRAIEKTWLTASNAKKNRVGSELKSMVKAPPGWVIVGADVDSEELWICSVMGDAQFGVHGATAIGWMTLEGTKAAGTDLHSKTASILGTSRNQAKVFNYSRIYGAGIRHATQLLLKANPAMPGEEATRLAKELYASTKGTNTHSPEYFGRKFWYGGTESFVFNKLEDVALSEQPRTPALDCGITAALSRKFLPQATNGGHRNGPGVKNGADISSGDFMPSRINWVVQSSGVDYLHLLVTSMDHLCRKYDIDARFMLSVHDEVRYLAKEEDAYRTSLALQIANLWTRAMFAFKLQMQDLPEGVAWFAQVDLDKVLRKEVDDPCVTPSQPDPVPVGEALDIHQTLSKTNGGSLHRDGRAMELETVTQLVQDQYPAYQPSTQVHRSLGNRGILFLQAQASDDIHEVRALERRATAGAGRFGSIDSVQRPGSEDLAEMAPRRVVKARSRSAAKPATAGSRSKTSAMPGDGSKRRPAKAAQSDRPALQRISAAAFCTSARQRSASAATVPMEASTAELLAEVQHRPLPPKQGVPFYRDVLRKRRIKWQLYRSLLRECPAKATILKGSLQRRFRKYRNVTYRSKANVLVTQAEELLKNFRLMNRGDPAGESFVLAEVRVLRQRRVVAARNATLHFRAVASAPPAPRPRMSGSLLPPTAHNAPLPRYKPVQPDAITMMIKRRRRRAEQRGFRRAEIDEERDMLQREVDIMAQIEAVSQPSSDNETPSRAPKTRVRRGSDRQPATTAASPTTSKGADEWLQPYEDEVLAFNNAARRETARAAMKFDPELLRELKEVRRRRVEHNTAKKRLTESEKGRQEERVDGGSGAHDV
ncbi:unnamed protein product [Parajaminaea phylloscopi]